MERLVRFSFFLVLTSACATARPASPVKPRLSPIEVAQRLSEADRLASRGCYLCLREAAAAYEALLAESGSPAVAARALENDLMIALREVELRMPDSGAREAAEALQARVAPSYATHFAALDALATPPVAGSVTIQVLREQRDARVKMAVELEKDALSSAMKAYFYVSVALQAFPIKDVKAQIDPVVAAQANDLSMKYKMLTFQPTYSGAAARDLVGMETGFGEVHYLIGQRALMGGNLADAFRELTRARQLLPDSLSITMALANVTLAYARYADALALYDVIVEGPNGPEVAQAQMGRAKALSHLKRHDEAIEVLDDLLTADAANNPGEKYYWRAWNRLQIAQAEPAYGDAMSGLNAMRNDAIYRLAGIASYSLSRLGESRNFFEEALQMNRSDCDSQRYLGLLDSAERSWTPASGRFSTAAACYDAMIGQLRKELAEYEKDITGLSNGLIAGKRAEIADAEALRAQSEHNAAAARKNATQ